MNTRRLLTALFLLLIPLAGRTGDVPARILSETVTIHVDENGRVTRHVRQVIQLNSFSTFRTFGEWFYSYNPELEDVRVIESVTIQKDSTRIPMPDNAMLDQTPYAVDHSPDFSHIRERMVSHTGLEPGCTVQFEYETKDRKPHRATLLEPMGNIFPIDEKTVTLQLDGNYRAIPSETVEVTDTHNYRVRNVPSIRGHAPFTSAAISPGILLIIDDPASRIRQVVSRPVPEDAMTTVWEEMACSPDTPAAEVERRLATLLRDTLDDVPVHPDLVGWSVRPPDRIIRSGYATNLEKAAIANAVLRAIGQKPAILVTDDSWFGTIAGRNPSVSVVGELQIFPQTLDTPAKMFDIGSNSVSSRSVGPDVAIAVNVTLSGNNTLVGTVTASLSGTAANLPLPVMVSGGTIRKKGDTTLKKIPTMRVITAKLEGSLSSTHLVIADDLLAQLHLKNLAHATLDATHVVVKAPVNLNVTWKIQGVNETRWVLPAPVTVREKMGRSSLEWYRHPGSLSGRFLLQLAPGTYTGQDKQQVFHILQAILNATNRTTVRLE